MIAAFISLLLALAAHLLSPAPAAAAPAAAVPVTSQVVEPSRASGSAPISAAPRVDVDPSACEPGEEWDGFRCVALQLPQETVGRQYDPAG